MQAGEVADICLVESGARGLSERAKDVALVAIAVAPDGAISMREYRRRIKETYVAEHPECGSVFLIFVLPVLISLISNWIAKWIIDRKDASSLRRQAIEMLRGQRPSATGMPTCITTPPTKASGQ